MACSSSDESTALKQWFDDHDIAASYGMEPVTIDVSVKFTPGFDASAYLLGSYGALGNVNGMEHTLYFGFETTDSIPQIWRFRSDTDSLFKDFDFNELTATVYWQKESEFLHDTLWLKFPSTESMESAPVTFKWAKDTFYVEMPEHMPKIGSKSDTLRLLVAMRLHENNTVLRIFRPLTDDIPRLVRAAQKTVITDDCEQCLHAGVRESLLVSIVDEININKTVVFAQLLLFSKQTDLSGSEFGLPLPVYVYDSEGIVESYRVDTAYVNEHGLHPNLVFCGGDTLKLQVTNGMRKGKTEFAFRLGSPMLIPQSLYFYNSIYSTEKVFADRPAYAKYDFGTFGTTAKLKLWYAKTDFN